MSSGGGRPISQYELLVSLITEQEKVHHLSDEKNLADPSNQDPVSVCISGLSLSLRFRRSVCYSSLSLFEILSQPPIFPSFLLFMWAIIHIAMTKRGWREPEEEAQLLHKKAVSTATAPGFFLGAQQQRTALYNRNALLLSVYCAHYGCTLRVLLVRRQQNESNS